MLFLFFNQSSRFQIQSMWESENYVPKEAQNNLKKCEISRESGKSLCNQK